MKKRGYLSGAGLLAASVIFAKVLGAAYRIPLANILGAEGMGIYQFVYPVFALLLTLSSGAAPTAISITVSKYIALGDEEGARRAFNVALKLCVIVGLAGSLILLGLSYPISLLQSKDAIPGYIAICPAVFIVTVISAFRGNFMGRKNLLPSSISQISEGIVKLAVGITLSKFLLKFGMPYAAAGALSGVAASEFCTLVILVIIFKIKDKEGFVRVKLRENRDTTREILLLASPLVLCGMILPLSQFADSVLLVNLLKWGNFENATADYGVFGGAVAPLVNLPVMVCITLGIAITPQMVEGREKRDVEFIMDKCNTATKLTLFLGAPFVVLYLFMSEAIVSVLFPGLGAEKLVLAGKLLKISALSVLGLSFFQIYSAMLQGLDKTYVPLKIMTISVLFKTLLNVVLVPRIGIVGAAVGSVAGYMLAGTAIVVYFAFFVRASDGFVKNAGLVTLGGVIMSLVISMCDKFLNGIVGILTVGAVSVAMYLVSMFVFKFFTDEELMSLPFGKQLGKFNKKLRQ